MILSVAIPSTVHQEAMSHLIRSDCQEDLCFALWYPSHGSERKTALIRELILPKKGERQVHGNASFSSAYFERALSQAVSAGAGLAFFHSHLGPGWQGMSLDDIYAERSHAAATKGATGYPLVGMTIGTNGAWSARFWEKLAPKKYARQWCHTVRVVGERLRVTYNDCLVVTPKYRQRLARTVSAWGISEQAHLSRLHVGIVGAGSVGSIVAESIARMGIAHVRLLDFDSVEEVNLGCLLHACEDDARKRRAKVQVLAKALKNSAVARPFVVDPLELSIVEESGFRAALDCDVLFSCVDRPWPRFVLNLIAYAHLIPVVDGGLIAQAKKTGDGLLRANWRAHVVAPSRRCLECLNQYDPGMVNVERDGYIDDPNYIQGLPEEHPFKRSENVFAFSAATASAEVLQFLRLVVKSPGLANIGAQLYDFVTANIDVDSRGCNPACPFTDLVAKGDLVPIGLTEIHSVAEQARRVRNKRVRRLLKIPLVRQFLGRRNLHASEM